VAVAHQAIQDGVAAVAHDDVERLVREARWSHDYEDYIPASRQSARDEGRVH
jgi:hypothetical protein